MSTEQNKSLVKDFWGRFSSGDHEGALGLLTEDATWWVAGNTLLSGTYSKEEFTNLLAGTSTQAPNGIQVTPGLLTAEDNRVSMEATSYGEIANGRTYQNIYHFMIECRDGKISAVREYLDTEHVTATFAE